MGVKVVKSIVILEVRNLSDFVKSFGGEMLIMVEVWDVFVIISVSFIIRVKVVVGDFIFRFENVLLFFRFLGWFGFGIWFIVFWIKRRYRSFLVLFMVNVCVIFGILSR